MKHLALVIAAGLVSIAPAAAQWGGGYNMGTIGVSGGDEAGGMIIINCAEAGNPVVPQGALSIFLKPAADSTIGQASPGQLGFNVDGTDIVLPVGDDKGDGFVFDKTPETLAGASQLIDLLKAGDRLTVTAGGSAIATIDLAGAGAALDGIEACLV